MTIKNNFFFVFLLFICGSASAQVVDKVVAIVNDEVILSSDLANLQKNLKKPGTVDENILVGGKPEDLKDPSKALDYLISEKILASEIRRLGYSVTEDRADQEFKKIAKRSGLSESELKTALAAQGVTEPEYKQFLKVKAEKQNLLDSEIISKLRVSDEEATSEFERRNPGKVISVKEYRLSHIYFNPKKSGGPEAALERARAARERLMASGSFEKLAEQMSEDPNFSDGGYLGTFKSGEFMPEIEAAILSLSAGQTTGIVRSKVGFHIVKVNNIKSIPDPKFAKERDRIKEGLMAQAFSRQFQVWLKSKREDAFIHINK